MNGQIIRLTIDSDMEKVYFAVIAIEALCNYLSLSEDTVFGLKLSTAEAMNNCVLHSYGNETGHEVEVSFAMDADSIQLKVCDTGRPMNPDILHNFSPEKFSDDEECIGEAEISGRGLSIIKKLMDTVNYETGGGKNCLVMTIRKNRQERE
ncbi:MAG: ATP-binding protein [Desulfobacterales bacterium]